MADVKKSLATVLQRSVDQRFSGVLTKTCPLLRFAKEIDENTVPNFPMNIVDTGVTYSYGYTHYGGYTINQPMPAPDAGTPDTTKFHDRSSTSSDVPDLIMRAQVEDIARFGNSVGLSNMEHTFLRSVNSPDIARFKDFKTSFRSFFSESDPEPLQGSVIMLLSTVASQIASYVRMQYAKHANIIIDLSSISSENLNGDVLISAIKKTIDCMTSFHSISSEQKPLFISSPSYVTTLLQGTDSLQWLSNRGNPITGGPYSPAGSRYYYPMAVYDDGTIIYPDSDPITHIAGSASNLTDLVIDKNPFGDSAAAWNTFETISKPISELALTSAGTQDYKLKVGDIIEVGTTAPKPKYLKLRSRSRALLASGNDLSRSSCLLRLIVQENATSTNGAITAKVNNLFHGYNVDASDFAKGVSVTVKKSHVKMFIGQKHRLYKKMFYKYVSDNSDDYINVRDFFSAEDNNGGNMGGNALLTFSKEIDTGNVRDFKYTADLRTHATFCAVDNFHGQVLLPIGDVPVEAYETYLNVKSKTA